MQNLPASTTALIDPPESRTRTKPMHPEMIAVLCEACCAPEEIEIESEA